MSYFTNSSSPPPLQHPVPTHPAYIPEPPSTPMSPQGYQRYTSSPSAPNYAQPIPNNAHPAHLSAPYPSTNQYQPPPHQPHLQGQIHPAPPVDFSAWGLDNATAAFGMQLGQSAVAAGQEYVQKNVSTPSSFSSLPFIHLPHSSAASSQSPCSSTILMSPTLTSSQNFASFSSPGDISPGPATSAASRTASPTGLLPERTSTPQTSTFLVSTIQSHQCWPSPFH